MEYSIYKRKLSWRRDNDSSICALRIHIDAKEANSIKYQFSSALDARILSYSLSGAFTKYQDSIILFIQ